MDAGRARNIPREINMDTLTVKVSRESIYVKISILLVRLMRGKLVLGTPPFGLDTFKFR
jgi:hypothetical protein